MNRHARAAAIRAQIQRAQEAGELEHSCPQCAESALYVALVERIEGYSAEIVNSATDAARVTELRKLCRPLVEAVGLLERPAASGSVH
jgi:hypothetical protein